MGLESCCFYIFVYLKHPELAHLDPKSGSKITENTFSSAVERRYNQSVVTFLAQRCEISEFDNNLDNLSSFLFNDFVILSFCTPHWPSKVIYCVGCFLLELFSKIL